MNAKTIIFLLAFSLAACGGAGSLPGSRGSQGYAIPTASPAMPTASPAPPHSHPVLQSATVRPEDEPNAAPPRLMSVSPFSSPNARLSVSRTSPTTLSFADREELDAVVTQASTACVKIVSSWVLRGVGQVKIVGQRTAPANCAGIVRVSTRQNLGVAYVLVP